LASTSSRPAPFDPSSFLDLAAELLTSLSRTPTAISNSDQARVRSSISRSYYAAFLTSRETLARSGQFTPTATAGDHEGIIQALSGLNTELGAKLDRLRMKRNQADSNLSPRGFTLTAGRHWLTIAREVVEGLNSLP
jgi:hypothetical protein